MSETTPETTPAALPDGGGDVDGTAYRHPVDLLVALALKAKEGGATATITNLGLAVHVGDEDRLLVKTSLPEGMYLASIPLELDFLLQMQQQLNDHVHPDEDVEEAIAAEAAAPAATEGLVAADAVVADEDEDDWLGDAQACSVDNPECEACQ